MRVLYLADRLATRGGADLHLLQVVGWAAEAGHGVTAAVGRVERGVTAPEGVRVEVVRGLGTRVASAAGLSRLDRLLGNADVVHVQNVMNPVAVEAAAATGRAVVTVQDHRVFCPGPGRTLPDGSRCAEAMSDAACARCLPDPGYRARMLELARRRLEAVRAARAVVVLSRYMAGELEAAGVPGARVIPPWVEVGPPRREAGAAFLLGGRLVAHKAPLDAVRAWEAAGPPLPLEVAGAGPLEEELGGAVRRLGWLGREALRAALRRARALLFPARWQEPFGILGLEALAEGTPVIVADVGGTRDWSEAGCLRVPPGDTGAMAAAVRRLAEDRALALALGEAGRRLVAERFARERIAPALAALYREVTGGAGGAARLEPADSGGTMEP